MITDAQFRTFLERAVAEFWGDHGDSRRTYDRIAVRLARDISTVVKGAIAVKNVRVWTSTSLTTPIVAADYQKGDVYVYANVPRPPETATERGIRIHKETEEYLKNQAAVVPTEAEFRENVLKADATVYGELAPIPNTHEGRWAYIRRMRDELARLTGIPRTEIGVGTLRRSSAERDIRTVAKIVRDRKCLVRVLSHIGAGASREFVDELANYQSPPDDHACNGAVDFLERLDRDSPKIDGKTLGELVITLCDSQREIPHQMEKWKNFTDAQKDAARAELSRQVKRNVKIAEDEERERARLRVICDDDRWEP